MLKKVDSFIIATSEFLKASEFFADILELTPTYESNYAKFELDGFPIFLARSAGNMSYISIETDDITGDYKVLREKGADFVEPIHILENGDKAAFFRSPGGFEFMLYEPVNKISRF